MAAQRGAPLSVLPPLPPPSALTGAGAFVSLFGTLIDKATAVGCALRRISPQDRSYNGIVAVTAGMFGGDLVRWLETKVDDGSITWASVANVAGDLAKTLAFIHDLAGKAPSTASAAPPGAYSASFPPPPDHHPRRVVVATYPGDDGNKRAETTMFGELDHRCANEITPKSALIESALSFAGSSEQWAQLCANLGQTTLNPDGSVAHHKADDRLVWAAAKELPESSGNEETQSIKVMN